jgi:1-phosphofructokinase
VITTVTLNPSFDLTMEVPGIEIGALSRATGERIEAAGKGVNVSRALAAHGIATRALAPIGPPATARRYRELLDAEAVLEVIPISGRIRTNVSIVTPTGVVTKINGAGPRYDAAALDRVMTAIMAAVAGSAWVVLAGSLPPGVPTEVYIELIRASQALGCRVALDAAGDALRHGVSAGPDLIKPNRIELGDLYGSPIATIDDAERASRALIDIGVGGVLASLGPDGALLVRADACYHACVAPRAVESPVGAGDALLAGFLANELDDPEGLRRAVGWGTAACRLPGSQVPGPDDVDLREVQMTMRPTPVSGI